MSIQILLKVLIKSVCPVWFWVCSHDLIYQAIMLDPANATLYSNRSFCHQKIGGARDALVDANACISLQPDWPKGYYRKGAALMSLKVRWYNFLVSFCFGHHTSCWSYAPFFFVRIGVQRWVETGSFKFGHTECLLVLFFTSSYWLSYVITTLERLLEMAFDILYTKLVVIKWNMFQKS
jgi:hypothetical protein